MENPALLADQKYQLVPLKKLKPHPDNVRMGNVNAIGQSITANQFYGALIVQRSTGHILAGNHRYLAAKEQGLDKVPVIWLDVDDEQALKILLVDNRTNDLAGNDEEKLAALLQTLPDLLGTGYDEVDLQGLLQDQASAFEPNLTPQVGATVYTEEDVSKANVQPNIEQKKLIEVYCPHCSQKFLIDTDTDEFKQKNTWDVPA